MLDGGVSARQLGHQGDLSGLNFPRQKLDPAPIDLDGVALSDEARAKLFGFDADGWKAEFAGIGEYLDEYGPRMPAALKDEQRRIAALLRG